MVWPREAGKCSPVLEGQQMTQPRKADKCILVSEDRGIFHPQKIKRRGPASEGRRTTRSLKVAKCSFILGRSEDVTRRWEAGYSKDPGRSGKVRPQKADEMI